MTADDAADWWGTAVSRIEPNRIELRGIPVQELIGSIGFGSMIWLMLRGERPTDRQAALLEAALVAGVDHGPHAPSIAVARMAITCGVGLNNAMASAVNTLGDSHGGAGQECVMLLTEILDRDGGDLAVAADEVIAAWRARGVRYLPGFGHRFHTHDPRRDPLLALVDAAVADGVVPGGHLRAARAVETALNRGRSRPVPMNIDGATAVIYAELGFPAPLARGLFVLSRSVGILAHAWEESQQGRRNKGPIPPAIRPTFLS
ncbi:citryl-CoA lyase [Paractinoplanes durhamensis]|uniref:citrate synthase (unknown stereospecificity) n=1 Tax=Paractinoplanes durhamensis TaxID=113563 RepID=A0ABQ3Z9G8_9ACTN|nr:citryl-CoA lyase [Actinoplanes durhamensis]GIE06475.1 citryl-CoA lyase [Actinoplanes durhamensis]